MSTRPSAASAADAARARLDAHAALVSLLQARPQKLPWTTLTELVRQRGDAAAVLEDLEPSGLFADPEQTAIRDHAFSDVQSWEAEGLRFLSILDEDYPAAVREIHQAPPFLFAKGTLAPGDRGVSVVGSRGASARGLADAREIATELVKMGLTVVAGLALGIDAEAHRAALDAGGRTVAVIGTGIHRYYPAQNKTLQAEIEERGLVLSQFWPDAPPQKHTFLMRNATMSGYGIATVVVEASEHSGTRAQARMAVEHGRPVVLCEAVVNATEWGRALVGRPGVRVARSANDVLAAIRDVRDSSSRIDSALESLVAV